MARDLYVKYIGGGKYGKHPLVRIPSEQRREVMREYSRAGYEVSWSTTRPPSQWGEAQVTPTGERATVAERVGEAEFGVRERKAEVRVPVQAGERYIPVKRNGEVVGYQDVQAQQSITTQEYQRRTAEVPKEEVRAPPPEPTRQVSEVRPTRVTPFQLAKGWLREKADVTIPTRKQVEETYRKKVERLAPAREETLLFGLKPTVTGRVIGGVARGGVGATAGLPIFAKRVITHPIKTVKETGLYLYKGATTPSKYPEFAGEIIGAGIAGRPVGKVIGRVEPPVRMAVGKVSPRYIPIKQKIYSEVLTPKQAKEFALKKPKIEPLYHVAGKEIFKEIKKGEFIVREVPKGLGKERVTFAKKVGVRETFLFTHPKEMLVGFGLKEIKRMGEPFAATVVKRPKFAKLPTPIRKQIRRVETLSRAQKVALRAKIGKEVIKRPKRFFTGPKAAAGLGFEKEFVIAAPARFKAETLPLPRILKRGRRFTYYEPAYARVELIGLRYPREAPTFKGMFVGYPKRLKETFKETIKPKKIKKIERKRIKELRRELPEIKYRKRPFLFHPTRPGVYTIPRIREMKAPPKRMIGLKVQRKPRQVIYKPFIRPIVKKPPREPTLRPYRALRPPVMFDPIKIRQPIKPFIFRGLQEGIPRKKKAKETRQYIRKFEYRPSLVAIERPRIKKIPKIKEFAGLEIRYIVERKIKRRRMF